MCFSVFQGYAVICWASIRFELNTLKETHDDVFHVVFPNTIVFTHEGCDHCSIWRKSHLLHGRLASEYQHNVHPCVGLHGIRVDRDPCGRVIPYSSEPLWFKRGPARCGALASTKGGGGAAAAAGGGGGGV